MADTGRGIHTEGSTLVRAAEWLGRTLGDWRRRRTKLRDDHYIRVWKRTWTQGCHARWGGESRERLPYKKSPERDAWLAGWLWADTQPDRRDPSRGTPSLAHGRRRASDVQQED